MKINFVILALTLILGISSVTATWNNNWAIALLTGTSPINFYYGLRFPFPWGTKYLAHPGPYYDSAYLSEFKYACDSSMHYEEYSLYFYLQGQGFFAATIGQ